MNLTVEKNDIQWCVMAIWKVVPCSGTSRWAAVICKVVFCLMGGVL